MIYIILPTNEVTRAILDKSTSDTLKHARKSLDGSQVVLEMLEDIDEVSSYPHYEINELREVLLTYEWDENFEGSTFWTKLNPFNIFSKS